jgi:D-beta-D-heptose 7-phosphate kinase / D-beta-D-heptose 1-phosphate adenosyltransferase
MASSDRSDALVQYVSAFPHCRVLVVGDAILDEYLIGDCSRISPEAPVPVLRVHADRQELGGAANTAANIVALGGHATLITLVGTDGAGLTLRRRATEAGIELMAVDRGTATLRKTRVIGQHQQIVRLDYEEQSTRQSDVESDLLKHFESAIGRCDIVVISDYAKGLLSLTLSRALIERAHLAGRQVIVDPRPQHRDFYQGCDYLTPNWKESRALLNLPEREPTPGETSAVAATLASVLNTNIVLTLGPQGIRFCSQSGNEQFEVPTIAREVFDVSGAGDTVAAALALSLAAGADHPTAIAIANRAASVVVGKFGTATVTPEEMFDDADVPRLLTRATLASLVTTLRAKGKRIVSVVGSFDILHNGHVHVLNEARKAGDVLVVGLRSDACLRSSSGSERAHVPEQERAEMLLALRAVDFVHIVDDLQPVAFLEELKPHVHVSGSGTSDIAAENAAVTRGGGRVHIVHEIPAHTVSDRSHPLQPRSV